MPSVLLQDRSVITVTGDDADSFMQGLVTCNIAKVVPDHPAYGAMLTPQGKVLVDFFIIRAPDGLLMDVPAEHCADLIRRLGFYRLRARVAITDRTGEDVAERPDEALVVLALSGDGWPELPDRAIIFPDPRSALMGARAILSCADARRLMHTSPDTRKDRADYDALRISACIPQGGLDFAYGDVFPHDINMDMLDGIAFDKGCYVGQEVVSRMKHRGSGRKRIVCVTADEALPAPGTAITAGDTVLGSMGSSLASTGLAAVRTDRLAEALASGQPVHCNGVMLHFSGT